MTWSYFCELWIIFNFWMGALLELMVIFLIIDAIVSDIKKYFRKRAARKIKRIPAPEKVEPIYRPTPKLPEKIK